LQAGLAHELLQRGRQRLRGDVEAARGGRLRGGGRRQQQRRAGGQQQGAQVKRGDHARARL
jgi:hypothetical protein